MKPLIILVTFLTIGTMAAHAQSTPSPAKAKLEQVKADPATKNRAAKADVHVIKKNPVICDSSSLKKDSVIRKKH
jgi:hypothetical protein